MKAEERRSEPPSKQHGEENPWPRLRPSARGSPAAAPGPSPRFGVTGGERAASPDPEWGKRGCSLWEQKPRVLPALTTSHWRLQKPPRIPLPLQFCFLVFICRAARPGRTPPVPWQPPPEEGSPHCQPGLENRELPRHGDSPEGDAELVRCVLDLSERQSPLPRKGKQRPQPVGAPARHPGRSGHGISSGLPVPCPRTEKPARLARFGPGAKRRGEKGRGGKPKLVSPELLGVAEAATNQPAAALRNGGFTAAAAAWRSHRPGWECRE